LLLFCAARALIFLLFTGIVRFVRERRRVPMTLLGPVVMVGCELVVPQIFPCGQYISQAWHPLVIQIAELTGPLGVTALLMLVNGALYDLSVDGRASRRHALAAAAVLAAALLFGAVRMRQVDDIAARAPRLKVGLVQPNFAYAVAGEFSRDEAIRQLTALQAESRRLQSAGAQLVVWSEGAYPATLPRNFSVDFAPEYQGMVRRGLTIPEIIGAEMYDPAQSDAFNSAILLDANGRVTGLYDKVRLLAFGEYIPGVEAFPWLRKLLPEGAGQFTAGKGPRVMSFREPGGEDWQLGPVICYEDILQGFLRGVGRLHPNLLVNLTSDSWFGADSEPWEHLALAVYAGVELRVGMVRAVNSGISALIDPNGRVVQKTYADDPYRNPRAADGIVVEVPRMPATHTVYVAVGDSFAYLCIAATLLLVGVAARSRVGR
jgi:apolipoprotein N-acyltransferase